MEGVEDCCKCFKKKWCYPICAECYIKLQAGEKQEMMRR